MPDILADLRDPRFDGCLNSAAADEIERLQVWERLATQLWHTATPDPEDDRTGKALVDFLVAVDSQLEKEQGQEHSSPPA